MGTLLALVLLSQAPATYTIGGTVVHSVSGATLDRVRVVLASTRQPGTQRAGTTGPDGRFRFEGLAPGKYSLSAQRQGFAPQAYGQRYLSAPTSTAVVAGDGEDTEDLVFRLMPGAALEGHITDSSGDPVINALVTVFRVSGAGPRRRYVGPIYGYTDDRGRYRIHSLPSGRFLVAVTAQSWGSNYRSGADQTTYPVAFYPGGASVEGAALLRLNPGQEARADMIVSPVAACRVTGILEGAGPRQVKRAVLTVPFTDDGINTYGNEVPLRQEGRVAEKTLAFSGVPAGHYYLTVLDEDGLPMVREAVDVAPPETVLRVTAVGPPEVVATVHILGTAPSAGKSAILSLRPLNGALSPNWPVTSGSAVSVPRVTPGRYEVVVTGQRPYAVVSVKVGDVESAAGIIDVPDSGRVELTVVADASAAEIAGRIVREGKPQAAAIALLVPRDRLDRVAAYRFDQSDSDGTFTWSGVAEGEYLMFAFEEGEVEDYLDESSIRPLLPRGKPLSVDSRSSRSVELDLKPNPPEP